jgi:hypothetical protein
MEQHIKALSKLCRVCQTQLTKPFSSVRAVITIESLINLIFPYDKNLFQTNLCQKCRRKAQQDVAKFKAFQRERSHLAEGKIDAECYLEHIGGRENLSVQSAIFVPHTEGSTCVICNSENDADDEFQTPPDSPTTTFPPPSPMDVDNFSLISSTPVRPPRAHNQTLDVSIISLEHSEYVDELPCDHESFMVNDSEVEEENNTEQEPIGRVPFCDCVPHKKYPHKCLIINICTSCVMYYIFILLLFLVLLEQCSS